MSIWVVIVLLQLKLQYQMKTLIFKQDIEAIGGINSEGSTHREISGNSILVIDEGDYIYDDN